MKNELFDFSPIEPAHPTHVKLQEDLYRIYNHIRVNFQLEIDKAFDKVSSQIGFVVTTTIGVNLQIDKKGTVSGIIITDGKQFQGTLYEEALNITFEKMMKKPFPAEIRAGEYKIYLFWFEALKLKLRTDWVEPVHYKGLRRFDKIKYSNWKDNVLSKERTSVRPEVEEPVHWFDPGIRTPIDEIILISVIDEIYPELKLCDKIFSFRESIRQVRPEVIEPVHFRNLEHGLEFDKIGKLLSDLGSVLRQYGY